jgi:hypothetical protein
MTVQHPNGARTCVDCGSTPADLPSVDEAGGFEGWLCESCERKRRFRQMGWSRRCSRRIRRWLQL